MNIAVVIPCYNVRRHILRVIQGIGPDIKRIYVVDDCCPERSGDYVAENSHDSRVRVLRHETNQGVGGAVMTGYQAAFEEGMEIIVKIDGDGQMDPALIPKFVEPIIAGDADYTKGNRFFNLERIGEMPRVRLLGNAALSFMNKLSSGYWHLFDPTNGYTAIHAKVARLLPFTKISRRYFFESDILFRLNILRAVVMDIPMDARYCDEVSNLKISDVLLNFLVKHCINLHKRIFYNYYLRDMSPASFELPLGLALLSFGSVFGAIRWIQSIRLGLPATAGTVMLSAMPIIIGLQFVLAFVSHDIHSNPTVPLCRYNYKSTGASEPDGVQGPFR